MLPTSLMLSHVCILYLFQNEDLQLQIHFDILTNSFVVWTNTSAPLSLDNLPSACAIPPWLSSGDQPASCFPPGRRPPENLRLVNENNRCCHPGVSVVIIIVNIVSIVIIMMSIVRELCVSASALRGAARLSGEPSRGTRDPAS